MNNLIIAAVVAAAAQLVSPAGHAANKDKPTAKTAKAASAKAAPAEIVTDVAPPSGSWEGKPPPAEGYVWSQGYYDWKDGRYQWKAGEWVLKQEGKEYRQHAWVQRPDGKWRLTGGEWVDHGAKVAGRS